jgi:hypothetical protein
MIFEIRKSDPKRRGTGSEPPRAEVGGGVNEPRPRCRHFETCYLEAGLFALLCARACGGCVATLAVGTVSVYPRCFDPSYTSLGRGLLRECPASDKTRSAGGANFLERCSIPLTKTPTPAAGIFRQFIFHNSEIKSCGIF